MGFLDHSTNNIILDAVLTDTGRQFLAKNDGSFSIQKFALGDDEINYSIIKKFGRTVGREKIEKNTPIFEALTNQSHSQKYRLNTISNPNLTRLPTLSLSGDASVDSSVSTINLSTRPGTGSPKSTVRLEQLVSVDTSIDNELRDSVFMVDVPDLFCQIDGLTPTITDGQRRSTYMLRRLEQQNAYGGSIVQFTIATKTLTSALFQVYGYPATRQYIKTYIKVTGVQSGSVKDITVVITQ